MDTSGIVFSLGNEAIGIWVKQRTWASNSLRSSSRPKLAVANRACNVAGQKQKPNSVFWKPARDSVAVFTFPGPGDQAPSSVPQQQSQAAGSPGLTHLEGAHLVPWDPKRPPGKAGLAHITQPNLTGGTGSGNKPLLALTPDTGFSCRVKTPRLGGHAGRAWRPLSTSAPLLLSSWPRSGFFPFWALGWWCFCPARASGWVVG